MGIRPVHILLPKDDPYRAVYFDGNRQLWAWFGTPKPKGPFNGLRVTQLTNHPGGVTQVVTSTDGSRVFYLKDEDGNEQGPWVEQELTGPIGSEQIIPGFPWGHSKGIMPHFYPGLCEADGTIAVNVCTSRTASGIYVRPAWSNKCYQIYGHEPGNTVPVAHELSRDGTFLALGHYEGSDALRPRLRAFDLQTGQYREMNHWQGREDIALRTLGFSPIRGDQRVLVCIEKSDEYAGTLAIWDPTTKDEPLPLAEFPTSDITAQWAPEGDWILIRMQDGSLTRLYKYSMLEGDVREFETLSGTFDQAWPTKNGEAVFLHTNSGSPLSLGATDRDNHVWPLSEWPEERRNFETRRIPYRPNEFPQRYGGLLEYLCYKPDPSRFKPPFPVIFLLHGGPHFEDQDRLRADIEALNEAGFMVVLINYAGSTGQGMRWRESSQGRPGFAELECFSLVYQDLFQRGEIDPDRVVIEGTSWGGYLALLAAGLMPDMSKLSDEQKDEFTRIREELAKAGLLPVEVGKGIKFAAVIAHYPCADLRETYETQVHPVAEGWVPRFRGKPEESNEVAELYRLACASTYIAFITAPVMMSWKLNDPFCPPAQIQSVGNKLWAAGKHCEMIGVAGGHNMLGYAGPLSAFAFSAKNVALSVDSIGMRPPIQTPAEVPYIHRDLSGQVIHLGTIPHEERMNKVVSILSGRRIHGLESELVRSLRHAGRVWLTEQLLLERLFLLLDDRGKYIFNVGWYNERDPDGPFWIRKNLDLWDEATHYHLHSTIGSQIRDASDFHEFDSTPWKHRKVLELYSPSCAALYDSYLRCRLETINAYDEEFPEFRPIPVESVRHSTGLLRNFVSSLSTRRFHAARSPQIIGELYTYLDSADVPLAATQAVTPRHLGHPAHRSCHLSLVMPDEQTRPSIA